MLVLLILSLNVIISEANNLSWKDEEDRQFWKNHGRETLKRQLNKDPDEHLAKNAILFIGDGMGVSTITAGRIRAGQLKGQLGESFITEMDKFPYIGLVKTYNIDYMTPDSAATATAYLCGVKARTGTIGMDGYCIQGDCKVCANHGVDSILRAAKRAGKSTGLITSTRITHASPASSYAHCPHRDWETLDGHDFTVELQSQGCKDIADQLIESFDFLDVVIGGGRRGFLPNTTRDPQYADKRGLRVDGRNLIDEWKTNVAKSKYQYVWSSEEFENINPDNVDKLLALLDYTHMPYEMDRIDKKMNSPSLSDMSEKAIRILQKNPNGYVLFVEGGRIDHAHHDNEAKASLGEFVALNEAIEVCINMSNIKDTQIVISADHSHVFNLGGYPVRNQDILEFVNSNQTNASDMDHMPMTALLYGNGPGYIESKVRQDPEYWKNVDLQSSAHKYEAAIPKKSETHGGEDVPVYARGPRSHLYTGTIEQSDIYHLMVYSMCLEEHKDNPNCWND